MPPTFLSVPGLHPDFCTCGSHCPECPSKPHSQPSPYLTPMHPSDLDSNAHFFPRQLFLTSQPKSNVSASLLHECEPLGAPFLSIHHGLYHVYLCCYLISGFMNYTTGFRIINLSPTPTAVPRTKENHKYLQNKQMKDTGFIVKV